MEGSFRNQVASAAAMLVGFYALGGFIVLALLGFTAAAFAADLPGTLWITIACCGSAFAIVRGLIPRRSKFEAPGPRLDEDEQPELHALVREVAGATGEEPPADIYLASDVNASVMDTGGLLGAGGRRVLVVGLPLLEVLTVGELRAVLAHEFGHYYGGDTRLGPWFFRTYDAIDRTVTNLEKRDSIWQRPFQWYGVFFLRRSASIKRRQEFLADELAARTGGRDAAIASLEAVHAASPAFDGFWESEFAPLLDAGARAPIVDGFRSFRSAPGIRRAIEDGAREQMDGDEADPYRTHPSLRERVAALEALPGDGRAADDGDDRPALGLLRDTEGAERRLLVWLFGEEVDDFERIDWDDVPERVIVPGWRGFMKTCRPSLEGIGAGDLPEVASAGLVAFGERLRLPAGLRRETDGPFPDEVYRDFASSALDIGLAVALCDEGWAISAAPGDPVVLASGTRRIKPIGTAQALESGGLSADEWALICVGAGIADLPLGGRPAEDDDEDEDEDEAVPERAVPSRS